MFDRRSPSPPLSTSEQGNHLADPYPGHRILVETALGMPRLKGKSDPLDAYSAARTALVGDGLATPKEPH
jgi:hypothetical protein